MSRAPNTRFIPRGAIVVYLTRGEVARYTCDNERVLKQEDWTPSSLSVSVCLTSGNDQKSGGQPSV